MKIVPFAVCALTSFVVGNGADPSALTFRSDRIGIPPLSLSESIAKGATTPKPLQFGAGLPAYSDRGDSTRSPLLVPPAIPNVLRREPSRSTRLPYVSRGSGMPILEPSEAVDYKMTVVPPNPAIDFKLVIKDPTPGVERQQTKNATSR